MPVPFSDPGVFFNDMITFLWVNSALIGCGAIYCACGYCHSELMDREVISDRKHDSMDTDWKLQLDRATGLTVTGGGFVGVLGDDYPATSPLA